MWSDLADCWILRSFTLEAGDESIDDEAQLPAWMLRIVRIDTLVLSLKSFGKACGEHIKLQGALAHVDRLCLECKEGLYVEVPQEQAWSWVNLHSDGELFVGFQSVGFFAETVRLFSFLYGVLQGTGLLSLVQIMQQRGMHVEIEQLCEVYSAVYSSHCSLWHLRLHDECPIYSNCRCFACSDCCRLDNFRLGPLCPCNKYLCLFCS